MNIIVDAMGGDNAPLEIVKGCALAVEEFGVNITLVGDEKIVKQCIADNQIETKNFSFVDCQDVITMEDHPDSILREHKNCSMATALRLLANDEGDAVVSAGNTGALVVGSTLYTKRIKGVKRAALVSVLPTEAKNDVVMLDSGANVECTPEMLKQFAVMANVYAKEILKLDNPRVGLLNVGTEDTKGGPLQKETFEVLKNSDLNFIGNIEARDILPGVCDVVVTDGFTGNVFLKSAEGAISTIMSNLKKIMKKNLISKLAASVLMKGLKTLAKRLDYTEKGGAPLLGISKPIIKAHGNSKAKAFKCGIKQAIDFAQSNAIKNIADTLKG